MTMTVKSSKEHVQACLMAMMTATNTKWPAADDTERKSFLALMVSKLQDFEPAVLTAMRDEWINTRSTFPKSVAQAVKTAQIAARRMAETTDPANVEKSRVANWMRRLSDLGWPATRIAVIGTSASQMVREAYLAHEIPEVVVAKLDTWGRDGKPVNKQIHFTEIGFVRFVQLVSRDKQSELNMQLAQLWWTHVTGSSDEAFVERLAQRARGLVSADRLGYIDRIMATRRHDITATIQA
jgi:hypothetical protein